MSIFRRRTPASTPEVEYPIEIAMADAVLEFRAKLTEDPDFQQEFGNFIREAHTEAEASGLEESKAHAEEYGDTPERKIPDEVHSARSRAFSDITSTLKYAGELEWDPETIVGEIRRSLGLLAHLAYYYGQLEPPLGIMDNGSIGRYYPELGATIVVWERVRGHEAALDLLSSNGLSNPSDNLRNMSEEEWRD